MTLPNGFSVGDIVYWKASDFGLDERAPGGKFWGKVVEDDPRNPDRQGDPNCVVAIWMNDQTEFPPEDWDQGPEVMSIGWNYTKSVYLGYEPKEYDLDQELDSEEDLL